MRGTFPGRSKIDVHYSIDNLFKRDPSYLEYNALYTTADAAELECPLQRARSFSYFILFFFKESDNGEKERRI